MIADVPGLISEVTNVLRSFTRAAVIGLSGGADSTLAAILCVKALGKDNVYGVSMPYNELDRKTFNARSNTLARHLMINHGTREIGDIVSTFEDQIYGEMSQINKANLRSRVRMVLLYTHARYIADTYNISTRVIGTGNLSEDYIGYDTKGGDALADIFPLGSLLKSEIYQLLDYFVETGVIVEEMIDRVPSAGLWDGQTDEEELGYSWAELEPSTLKCIRGSEELDSPVDKFVWGRHLAHKHKHEVPPVIELRNFCRD